MRRVWPLILFIAACGADKRGVGSELPPAGEAGSEGEGEGDGEGRAAEAGAAEGAEAAEGEEGQEGGAENEGGEGDGFEDYVGCPPGRGTDHNGCRPLASGRRDGACATAARASISGAFAVEDLDTLAPWSPVPGRTSAQQRRLILSGTVTALRPGHLEVTEEGGEGRVVRLEPAARGPEVVPTAIGEAVDLEYSEYLETILHQDGREIRQDRAFLLRVSRRAEEGERFGLLLYAIGDPIMPPRRQRNLENLGIDVQQADEQPCGFTDVSDARTPVGLCRIYRRAASYKFGESGRSVVVLPSESGEFTQDGRIFRVDSGDTHDLDDSDDNCNVPPKIEVRLTYLRPAE